MTPTAPNTERRAYLDRRAEAAIHDYAASGLRTRGAGYLAAVFVNSQSDLDCYESAICELEDFTLAHRQSVKN